MQGTEVQRTSEARRRRIFLVEDHAVVRQGLARLINQEPDLEVCGEAENVSDALPRLAEDCPDLVVLDLSLGESSGLELIEDLTKSCPDLPILVLSMHDELLYGQRALRAGARGYLMKRADVEVLMSAIRRVLAGDTYISPRLVSHLLDPSASMHRDAWRAAVDRLTERERQVFELIGKGLGSREIAEALRLSTKTIETYRESIKTKLGLSKATELQRAAFRWVEGRQAGEP